jgi:hypothetical protein
MRRVRHIQNLWRIYQQELLEEEGFPGGLIWERTESLEIEAIPDMPGVLATATGRGLRVSVNVVPSLQAAARSAQSTAAVWVAVVVAPDPQTAAAIARHVVRLDTRKD